MNVLLKNMLNSLTLCYSWYTRLNLFTKAVKTVRLRIGDVVQWLLQLISLLILVLLIFLSFTFY